MIAETFDRLINAIIDQGKAEADAASGSDPVTGTLEELVEDVESGGLRSKDARKAAFNREELAQLYAGGQDVTTGELVSIKMQAAILAGCERDIGLMTANRTQTWADAASDAARVGNGRGGSSLAWMLQARRYDAGGKQRES